MTPPAEVFERIAQKLEAAAHGTLPDQEQIERLKHELAFLQLMDWPANGEQRLEALEAELDAALEDVEENPAGDDAPDWPEPRQLVDVEEAPAMPADLIPEQLRAWLVDEAERMSVPIEMVAIPAIVSLGAAAGRTIALYPKRYDLWQVVPNLWGAVVAPPSSLKSPALEEGTRPMDRIAADALAEHEADRHKRDAEAMLLEGKLAKLHKEAAGTSPRAGLAEDFASLKEEYEALQRPAKRYITNDPTVEMLTELLRTNERGLLVVRDELVGLLYACEKKGREGDREFFLEAFNAKENYTVDRIGRGTVRVPSLTLSIIGGIQPGKLESYVVAALAGGRGADGLLQRFQLTVYPEPLTDYVHVDRPVDLAARERVQHIYEQLSKLDPDEHPELERNPGRLPALRFTPEAQAEFDEWFTAHMRRLRSKELATTPAYQAHLGKYQGLVGKLALLFHLVSSLDDAELRPVSVEALRLAIRWVDFLEAHARKVYASELTRTNQSVRELALRIYEGDLEDGMTVRDVYRKGWRGLKTQAQVKRAIEYLSERGWLRLHSTSSGTGRPSQTIRINPRLNFSEGYIEL